jgi:hypothetical protein
MIQIEMEADMHGLCESDVSPLIINPDEVVSIQMGSNQIPSVACPTTTSDGSLKLLNFEFELPPLVSISLKPTWLI